MTKGCASEVRFVNISVMEKKQNATSSKPPVVSNGAGSPAAGLTAIETVHRTLFINMALEMSWQLAVVVLVPILGGYALDNALQTSPWFVLGGMIIAAAGVIAVLVRVVKVSNQSIIDQSKNGDKR